MQTAQLTRYSTSAAQTEALGAQLGRLLRLGDIVCLDGELGAGKSCFARGLGRGLLVPVDDPIASPSFTLIAEHDGRLPFVHADLYRIEAVAELDALGLEEYFERAVTAVEWFDRFESRRPHERIDVRLAFAEDDGRVIELRAFGAEAVARLAALGEAGA